MVLEGTRSKAFTINHSIFFSFNSSFFVMGQKLERKSFGPKERRNRKRGHQFRKQLIFKQKESFGTQIFEYYENLIWVLDSLVKN